MKRLTNLLLALSTGYGAFWCLNKQNRQNLYGIYLSTMSSCRSAWIVYDSYLDYQSSLDGIAYNSQQYHQARHQVHFRVANRILQLSKDNRGIYLKLGQYLGNLEKVVPWEFTHVLKVLQDSAPPLPYKQMKIIFQTDLNKNSEEIFSFIDQNPLASASLAQVHRGILASNNQEVAIKIQYPFLKVQSKWDLIMLRQLTKICNYLVKHTKNANFDFVKLFNQWTATLVEELDFGIQLQNALKAKQLFKHNDAIYIPQYYSQLSSDRLIVMQFVKGIKVSQKDKMIEEGINPVKVGRNLVNIFATMIFKHGFVHCDAHPGNFLIRKKQNSVGHQIILLDHGLYRSLKPQTIKNFSGLFVNLLLQDKHGVHDYALKLNIHKHFQYLPLIFLHRSRNSKKKIGQNITEQQKKQFRSKDLANFDSINHILQDLPPELMYIIRANNLISSHNSSLGGSNRDRIFHFTQQSLQVLYPQWLTFRWNYFCLIIRIWLFESVPTLYKSLFGTLQSV